MDDFAPKITAIQSTTRPAIETIGRISTVIPQIHGKRTTIAAAGGARPAITMQLSRGVGGVADGADHVAADLDSITEPATQTLSGADATQQSAAELASLASRVPTLLGPFTSWGGAPGPGPSQRFAPIVAAPNARRRLRREACAEAAGTDGVGARSVTGEAPPGPDWAGHGGAHPLPELTHPYPLPR